MDNQKGEVVTAVLVIMMGVMMIFSGLHLLREDRGYERDHSQIEHRHHRDEDMQHMRGHFDERDAIPARDEDR